MSDQEIQTLINTLIQGGLASSENEARRMAEDMLGTTAKVQNEYNAKKESTNMFAREIQEKKEKEEQRQRELMQEQERQRLAQQQFQSQQIPQIKENSHQSESMQNKIQELRNAALNPKPVDVQINFQTPKTDREKQENIMEPQFSQEEVNSAIQKQENNQIPSVDFKIPGVDSNMSISELASTATTEEKPAMQVNQEQPQQNNFFAQQNNQSQSHNFEQPRQEVTNNVQENKLEAGFPSSNQYSKQFQNPVEQRPQNQFEQPISNSDFIQMKEDLEKIEEKEEQNQASNQFNSNGFNTRNPFEAPQQHNNQFGQPQQQRSPPQQASPEHKQETPNPQSNGRNSTWTEEEKKLKEEVDLSKIFNFNK